MGGWRGTNTARSHTFYRALIFCVLMMSRLSCFNYYLENTEIRHCCLNVTFRVTSPRTRSRFALCNTTTYINAFYNIVFVLFYFPFDFILPSRHTKDRPGRVELSFTIIIIIFQFFFFFFYTYIIFDFFCFYFSFSV